MKNQYVADINDFRKYGLIRSLLSGGALTCGVFWMLTGDDTGNDGNILKYLDKATSSESLDPELFQKLKHMVHTFKDRTVARIQQEAILPRTLYVEDLIPDDSAKRDAIFKSGMARLAECDLIFFDPDNGLEIKSKRKGQKKSNKFLYLDEIQRSFSWGHSLLIYQHFPRIARQTYVASRVAQLKGCTGGKTVFSFSTGYVCFFLVAQATHSEQLRAGIESVKTRWSTQFTVEAH